MAPLAFFPWEMEFSLREVEFPFAVCQYPPRSKPITDFPPGNWLPEHLQFKNTVVKAVNERVEKRVHSGGNIKCERRGRVAINRQ